jgi:phosphoribosylglycinamide formyltransferase-1
MYKVIVLASGDGSNLQALIDQVHGHDARIVAVASDKPAASALKRALEAGIPTVTLPPLRGEGRVSFHRRLGEGLKPFQPDLLVLAGYMRLVPPGFIEQFSPIINVHPSLLPAFPGLDAPAQALAAGVKVSGCTVHLVDEGLDSGPILLQKPVPVLPFDTPGSLHQRIKVQEQLLLVQAVRAFARGEMTIICEGS